MKKKEIIITEITGFRKNKKALIDKDDDVECPWTIPPGLETAA